MDMLNADHEYLSVLLLIFVRTYVILLNNNTIGCRSMHFHSRNFSHAFHQISQLRSLLFVQTSLQNYMGAVFVTLLLMHLVNVNSQHHQHNRGACRLVEMIPARQHPYSLFDSRWIEQNRVHTIHTTIPLSRTPQWFPVETN